MSSAIFSVQPAGAVGVSTVAGANGPSSAVSAPPQGVLAYGEPAADGFEVLLAAADSGWAWTPVVTLDPNDEEGPWIGNTCVTGDGRYIIAVIGPQLGSDQPAAMDGGGAAFAVSVATHAVTPLLQGVSLAYYDPGCGVGSNVALVSYTSDEQTSTVAEVDPSSSRVVEELTAPEEVSSVVPGASGLLGVAGTDVVQLSSTGVDVLATIQGAPYDLRPGVTGTDADILATDGGTGASLWALTGGQATELGSGSRTGLRLYLGSGGRNLVSGLTWLSANHANITALPATSSSPVAAALSGLAVAVAGPTAGRTPSIVGESGTLQAAVPLPPAALSDAGLPPNVGRGADAPAGRQPNAASAANDTTPTCAVPRNDPTRQVLQPDATQVDWAAQQAVQGLLKGKVLTRPANFANTGVAKYQPSVDFPAIKLDGGGTVPRSVVEGILAQESNFLQASWHALPGVPGNPLIADYYGAGGGIDSIDFSMSDCGYGVAQITSGMTAGGSLPAATQTKIAVDYAENVAAATNLLGQIWNQLWTAGITYDGGNSSYVESWYPVLWAYNTGVQPTTAGCTPSTTCTDGSGNWGLGWTNNPINSLWDPSRPFFLDEGYQDAAEPQLWPYQEKVLGWMGHPQLDYQDNYEYVGLNVSPNNTSHTVTPAPFATFCTALDNCSPSFQDGTLSYCMYTASGATYRHCWWHSPVNPDTCSQTCHTSTLTVSATATEPAVLDPYPAQCSSTLPSTAIIVGDLPEPYLNLAGCTSRNWKSQGTFTLSSLVTTPTYPVAAIDTHQLGVGLGGHIWFTHNREEGDTAHEVVGTWNPKLTTTQAYSVLVHVPQNGATTTDAQYQVTTSDGAVFTIPVNQYVNSNTWIGLGYFELGPNSTVSLSNITNEPTSGIHDVAYDAMSFTPVTGTVTSHTVVGAQIFVPTQSLNTNLPGGTSPFDSDSDAMHWGTEYSYGGPDWQNGSPYVGIGELPVCTSVLSSGCVGPNTAQMATEWYHEIQSENPAQWLDFSVPVPPNTITSTTFSSVTSYKVLTQLTATFLTQAGKYVPGSAQVEFGYEVGDTHISSFLLNFIAAIAEDYGIVPPSMVYAGSNFNEDSGEITGDDAYATGLAPGTAYPPGFGWTANNTTGCVSVGAEAGGPIGYRALDSSSVPGNYLNWKHAIDAETADGVIPQAVDNLASQIYQNFFDPEYLLGALFNEAPPIWQEYNLVLCPNGKVTPVSGTSSIIEGSYMPNLYVYEDGNNVLSAGGPYQVGDFPDFSNPPGLANFTGNAYGLCDLSTRGHGGNPWGIVILDPGGYIPNTGVYCDAPLIGFGGPGG